MTVLKARPRRSLRSGERYPASAILHAEGGILLLGDQLHVRSNPDITTAALPCPQIQAARSFSMKSSVRIRIAHARPTSSIALKSEEHRRSIKAFLRSGPESPRHAIWSPFGRPTPLYVPTTTEASLPVWISSQKRISKPATLARIAISSASSPPHA